MRAAFDHISDPTDPAWDGFADELAEDAARQRLLRRIGLALCGAAAITGCVVAALVVLGGDPQPGARTARAAAAPAVTDRTGSVPMTDAAALARAARTAKDPVGETAKPVTGGSGWAPAEATIEPSARYLHLEGDLAGLRPSLMQTLDRLAAKLGQPIEIVSGWRTHHEQGELYSMYQNGTGNLAAVPGTSMHETGDAADVYIDGVALADVPGAREAASGFGLHFPVPGEAWHVESR